MAVSVVLVCLLLPRSWCGLLHHCGSPHVGCLGDDLPGNAFWDDPPDNMATHPPELPTWSWASCHRCTRRQWHQPGLSACVKGLVALVMSCVKVSRAGDRHASSWLVPMHWVHGEGPEQAGMCGCCNPFLQGLRHQCRIHQLSAWFALIVWFSHPELATEEEGTHLGCSLCYSKAVSPFGWMNCTSGVNLSLLCIRGALGTQVEIPVVKWE